ncbi:MAG: Gfo/Idh/MocA family oxidoreductase [Firmicutes bacterium]|nr:Gfo/Idh/MocA family oxidoreductase [Bacillota bacterium]
MDKIKIGFVGVGFMGQLAHLSNYAVLDDCEVVAIAEPRRELAEKVARRYGVGKIYRDHRELLEKCDVDAIVAAQPYRRHFAIIPDILEAGKPVLTEKPLALTVEAGERLVKLAEEKGILHMLGYHKRSDLAVEYAKKLVDEWKASGELGRMRFVRITMPPGDWVGGGASGLIRTDEPQPVGELEPMPEYFDKEAAEAYDAFVNYYIHQVNMMRFMLGEHYEVSFADRSGVLLAVESVSGVCGTIEMAPYVTSVDWQEEIFVGFERGYIKVELPAPLASQQAGRVTVMRDTGKDVPITIQPSLPKVSAMRQQARNFLAAVRGDRLAPCDSKEALEDLKIARRYIELHMSR